MVNQHKVGILGGTFDPIHIAHLIIAEECRFQLDLAQVFFIPAGMPPHKQVKPLTNAEARIAMVQLAIATNPYFAVSRLDIDRPGPCYSADTVELLQQQLAPETDIYFIVGLDSLIDMPTWHEPLRLIRQCQLAVVGRPNYHADLDALEKQLPGISSRTRFVDAPQMEISSSMIQQRVRTGMPITYQVLEVVERYIQTHRLYH